MIDTNIFISAVLFPAGRVSAALEKALLLPYQPFLRAALAAGVDLLLTGDKDFLESSVRNPRIISVSDFLAM